MRKALVLTLLLLSTAAYAGKHESEYTRVWCTAHGGEQEYTLANGMRVDCLTGKYAVEVERAYKWPEAIGQSLYYAAATASKPAIVLIMGPGDQRHLRRLRMAIRVNELPITIWTVIK